MLNYKQFNGRFSFKGIEFRILKLHAIICSYAKRDSVTFIINVVLNKRSVNDYFEYILPNIASKISQLRSIQISLIEGYIQ